MTELLNTGTERDADLWVYSKTVQLNLLQQRSRNFQASMLLVWHWPNPPPKESTVWRLQHTWHSGCQSGAVPLRAGRACQALRGSHTQGCAQARHTTCETHPQAC